MTENIHTFMAFFFCFEFGNQLKEAVVLGGDGGDVRHNQEVISAICLCERSLSRCRGPGRGVGVAQAYGH